MVNSYNRTQNDQGFSPTEGARALYGSHGIHTTNRL